MNGSATMTASEDPIELARLAYDRGEIADALYRYAAGLDGGDVSLLASAFTEDCVVDFTPAAARVGLGFPVLSGRDVAVKSLASFFGTLDTSHTVSNVRATVTGDAATVTALVMEQHFLPGEGPSPDPAKKNALFMNRLAATLVRDGLRWRMSRLTVDNVWFRGDRDIVTAIG